MPRPFIRPGLLVVVITLAASVLPLRPQPTALAAAPKAYVGLFKDNAVAVLDTGTKQLLGTIPVPPGPHGIVITPDGKKVYVSSDGASTVSVVDTATDKVVTSIEVGKEPHGLAITPDGRRVLVNGFGSNQVAMIDTAADKVVSQVGVPNPHNAAITPNGTIAYVGVQAPGAPALAVLDLKSGTRVASVALDKNPRGLSVSPDGSWLYVTQAGSESVAVFETAGNTIVGQIPVGPSPHFPVFTSNGEYGLVNPQGLNQLSIIDPATQSVTAAVPVGQNPHWIAVAADDDTAYVTNEGSGDVSVVDIEDHTVTATIPVGNGPRKIAIQPMGEVAIESHIAAQAFQPTIKAAPGQQVRWINDDSVPHTVTAADGTWDSGDLRPGAGFILTLDTPGTYAYRCSFHSFMRGELVIG